MRISQYKLLALNLHLWRKSALSKSLWLILGGSLILILVTSWNETNNCLQLFGIDLPNFGLGKLKMKTIQDHYFDITSMAWVFILAAWGFKFILLPLSLSFTVNQTLWLRLSEIKKFELNLSRVIKVLVLTVIPTLLLTLIGFFYHLKFDIALGIMILPILGFSGHLLLASGIIISLPLRPNSQFTDRIMVVIFSILVPIICAAFFKEAAYRLNGWLPIASPLIMKSEVLLVMTPFLSCNLLGLMLLLTHPIKAFIQSKL